MYLHGEQVAYQVAFMIVASKYNLEHHGTLAENVHYTQFLNAWPQVFPLAERALHCFRADRYNNTSDDETQPTRPSMDMPAPSVQKVRAF
jgi:hypothetical protein